MNNEYTYRELQTELKMFRDEYGYSLEIKLSYSKEELIKEWVRITDLIEEAEADTEDDIYDELEEEEEEDELVTELGTEMSEPVSYYDYNEYEIEVFYNDDKKYFYTIDGDEGYSGLSSIEEAYDYAIQDIKANGD